jgi:hypothetical protein
MSEWTSVTMVEARRTESIPRRRNQEAPDECRSPAGRRVDQSVELCCGETERKTCLCAAIADLVRAYYGGEIAPRNEEKCDDVYELPRAGRVS